MKTKISLLVLMGFCILSCAEAEAAKPLIEVKVEITEVDESRAKELGLDWLSDVRFEEKQTAGLFSLGSIERLTKLRTDLRFLAAEGAAKLLAEPNLVMDGGETASFLAGGEIPFVTATSLGATNVEFKPYGVSLKVKPQIKSPGKITLKVSAGVSAPDEANGAQGSGFFLPALRQREVTSTVTVPDGVTLVLAGLSQNNQETRQSGVPVFKKIPFLGRFFRWEKTLERVTSVVIFVTPKNISNN